MSLKGSVPESDLESGPESGPGGEPEKYLRDIILDASANETGKYYTAPPVREILPITRRLFEENVCLAREFNIPKIMEKEKHLLIYGEAGSGKTAALKWLEASYARRCLEKSERFVPVYAALDSYVKGPFYDYLKTKAEQKGISEACFKKLLEGKALLLFDGLDLLTPSDNFHPFEEISDFISEYEACRYVIASRPGSFAIIKSTFGAFELEKFTDENIREFIEKHIHEEEEAKILTAKTLKEARSNPFIRNPLMLCLWLKIATGQKETARFEPINPDPVNPDFLNLPYLNPDPLNPLPVPSSRSDIFRVFIFERAGHDKTGSEMKEIENVLIDLAFKLQCKNKLSCEYLYALDIAEKHLKDSPSGRMEARELIQACTEIGLLTKKGAEIRIGTGRSFQEYFAALKLKTYFENGKDISEAFRHPGWENVLMLTSELVESADELVNSIITGGELWLASKCAGKAGPETKEKLCSLLAGKLESRFTPEKIKAIRSLEKLGNCGIGAAAGALHDEEVLVRREAVRVLGETKSEAALPPLTGALGDEEYSVRREAVRALGTLGSGRAVELLTKAFEDENRAVRLEATEALAQVESERTFEILVNALTSDDDFVRLGAIGALGRAKTGKAADPLIKAFQEGDNFVRLGAAEALGRMKSEKAIAILTEALEDEDKLVRWMAAKALGEIESEGTHELLVSALVDENHCVRREAAKALGMIGPESEKALDSLISALTDEAESVRKEAAEALGLIGAERAVGPLISLLSDREQSVRLEAARALGMIECTRAVDPLLLALTDESHFVRKGAAKALGQLELEKTLEPLIRAFGSGDIFVKRETVKILARIKAVSASEDISHRILDTLITALVDEDEFVRREAAKALGNISEYEPEKEPEREFEKEPERGSEKEFKKGSEKETEKVLQPLINALKDEDEEVRKLASEALGNLNSEIALYPLIDALKSEDGMVRRLAAEALGRIKSEKALEPLIELTLGDNVDFVRGEAARALGKIKSEKAIEPLITALTDENNGGRWGAAEALGRMKAENAVDPLINALYDYDDFTRLAAAKALGRIKPKKAIEPLIDTLYDWNRFVKAESASSLSEICTKDDEALLKVLLSSEDKFTANLAFEILEGIETRERSKARLFRK
ncbi:NACHT domain-containing protein [Methanosarcina sp. KYL-1]|uniref:HEAT repeat domain-containing protein n=1 Tax=Methanosarcina sp. KYL-1 TaxID=2602068 RepID=UPI0021008334|nr:HEAT repeat domain-containing protein [Methanosarcina sp. KYL-1]MCQ1536924.1 NACHT domain-containing protein [Methanosarcina sp. KYL-1]